MFNKNDKWLITARTICMALVIIACILGIIYGIVVMAGVDVILGLLCIVVVVLASLFVWVLLCLLFSFLADVKFIRNKLYGESNENLYMFLYDEKNDSEESGSDTKSEN